MTDILVDYRTVVLENKLDLLMDRVGPAPDTSDELCLILAIPKSTKSKLDIETLGENRIHFINTTEFVHKIRGSAYLVYNQKQKLAEISNVIGDNMAKHIVSSSLSYLPEDITLLVCTGLESDLWKPYVKLGFRNPLISTTTPLLGVRNKPMLILSRCNAVVEKPNAEKKVQYVLETYNKTPCEVKFRLSKASHDYLKTISNFGSSVNNDSTVSQKEASGILRVKNIDNRGVHVLEIDRESLNLGREEEAVPAVGLYSFHSHPREAYERNSVNFAFPSRQDFESFLMLAVLEGTIVHFVTALEGLYSISLSKYWSEHKSILPESVLSYIRKNYDLKRLDGRDAQWFVDTVNNLMYMEHPLFVVQFIRWTENPTMKVFYSNYNRGCVADQGTSDFIKRF